MSGLTLQNDLTAESIAEVAGEPSVGDYVKLMKPRVMSLVVFTALVGMVCAPGHIHPLIGLIAIIAITVGAGASGALNMWYDADIDARMARTAARPIPRGHVTKEEALAFGSFLSAASVLTLGVLVDWVAGTILALTIAFYIFVYTIWLKRRTPQNIVIGGAAGAFPPMIGWAGVTGGVSIESIVLFMLIFLWTPPHFWALALYRCRDYERVGVPMLPVVAGADSTRNHILAYSVIYIAFSLAPVAIGLGGAAYLFAAVASGLYFMALAVNVWRVREGREGDSAARALFQFSIFHLFLLFAVLLGEHAFTQIGA